jgi:hypothetical protein
MNTQLNNDMYFERRVTTLEMKFENIDKKLDDLISGQINFVTKQDLQLAATKFDNNLQLELAKIDHKIDKSINKMVWKLGSIIVAWITIYPFILQFFHK